MNLKLDLAIIISFISFLFYFTGKVYLEGYLSVFNLRSNTFFDIQDYIYYSVIYNFELVLWLGIFSIIISLILSNNHNIKLIKSLIIKNSFKFNDFLNLKIYKEFTSDLIMFTILITYIFFQIQTKNQLPLILFTSLYIFNDFLLYIYCKKESPKDLKIKNALASKYPNDSPIYFSKENTKKERVNSLNNSALRHYSYLIIFPLAMVFSLTYLINIEKKGKSEAIQDLSETKTIAKLVQNKEVFYLITCSKQLCIISTKDKSKYFVSNIEKISFEPDTSN